MKARLAVVAVPIVAMVATLFVIGITEPAGNGVVIETTGTEPTVATEAPTTTTTVDPATLAAFYEAVAASQTTTTTSPPQPSPTTPPTTATPAPAPVRYGSGACGGDLPPCYVMMRESGGNITAQNPTSTASGKWQFLDSTWGGYGGYAKARYAPEWVQDERARQLWAGGAGCSHWNACS